MNTPLRISIAAAFLVALAPPAVGQGPDVKWGVVAPEDFLLEPTPPDPDASAIILAQFGRANYYYANSKMEVKIHVRMKIVSEAGYEKASQSLIDFKNHEIEGIEAQTFSIDESGWITRTEMDDKSIFTEKIGDNEKVVRFTLPALAPGVIVEWRYTHVFDGPFTIPTWYFQSDVPVLWSDFQVDYPMLVEYVFAVRNVDRFVIQTDEKIRNAGYDHRRYHWAVRDQPALREEEFMQSPSRYIARLDVQLYGVRDVYGFVPMLKNWNQLAELVRDERDYKSAFRPSKKIRKLSASLTNGLEAPVEQLEAIYDYVRKTVHWDGTFAAFSGKSPDDLLKDKTGASAEVNLLLLGMLRAAGFVADPILVSTREHGSVVTNFPLLDQFDHALTQAVVDGKTYLLDATDPDRPFNLLPEEVQDGPGFLIQEDQAKWVDVSSGGWYGRSLTLRAELDSLGGLTARLETLEREYSAKSVRANLQNEELSDLILSQDFAHLEGVEIDSAWSDLDREDGSVLLSADVRIPTYAQQAGEYLYLNPLIVGRYVENPLPHPTRLYPLELRYRQKIERELTIALPDDYEVVELPRPVSAVLSRKLGSFKTTVTADEDNVLHVGTEFVLASTKYPVEYYDEVRRLFARAVAASNDQVVLRHKAELTAN